MLLFKELAGEEKRDLMQFFHEFHTNGVINKDYEC